MVIVGGLLTVVGFGALVGGGAALAVQATARDSAGFYHLPATRLETSTAALVTPFELGPALRSDTPLGTVELKARSLTAAPVFIGIAPADQVDRWLSGVARTRVTDWGFGPAEPRTQRVEGIAAADPPAGAGIWVASASGSAPGSGEAGLTWQTRPGQWAIVVMNASGQPGLAVEVTAGSDTGLLLPIGLGALAIGILLASAGIAVAVMGVRRDQYPMAVPSVPGSYPVRLNGQLDPELSRWRWLVKWFLAIPHYVVLALLWLAVLPLTVVAGFAILFTGRYPRPIFEFNVGVMRWSWRVSYYAFGALGTDRYPPFTLDPVPDYPADFSVDYPERLSRGLVLVKWWLLAIPHLLIVAVLSGGWTSFGIGRDQWWFGLSGSGLIGILVLVAAIVLAVGGTYPPALFDVVMGLNRWCYRVFAYVALMRDEYPPFRFDAGGPDPGTPPPLPTGPVPDPDLVGLSIRS